MQVFSSSQAAGSLYVSSNGNYSTPIVMAKGWDIYQDTDNFETKPNILSQGDAHSRGYLWNPAFQLSITSFTVWQKGKLYSERQASDGETPLENSEGLQRAAHFQCCVSRPRQYYLKFKNIFMCSESCHCPPDLVVAAVNLGDISPSSWRNCPNLSTWHLHCRMLLTKQSFYYFGFALKLEVNSFRCNRLLPEKPQVSYLMLPVEIP